MKLISQNVHVHGQNAKVINLNLLKYHDLQWWLVNIGLEFLQILIHGIEKYHDDQNLIYG